MHSLMRILPLAAVAFALHKEGNPVPPSVDAALKMLNDFRKECGVLQQPFKSDKRYCLAYMAHYPDTTATQAKDPILQGQTDYPLAPGGKEKAYQMGKEIIVDAKKEGRIVSTVLTADSDRAKETAEAIAKAFRDSGQSVKIIATKEMRGEYHGLWEGKPRSWIKQQPHSKVWDTLTAVQRFVTPYAPEGEPKEKVLERMIRCIESTAKEALEENPSTPSAIVAIASGAFFKGMAVATNPEAEKLGATDGVGHGGIQKFEVTEKEIAPIEPSRQMPKKELEPFYQETSPQISSR